MRSALIEAAWMDVEYHPQWKGKFERLAVRIGKGKAIVAIARKLLVVIWHVLTKRLADQHADVAAVGRKLLRWGKECGAQLRGGMMVAAFARHHLDRLRLGMALEALDYGGRRYALPPSTVSSA